MRLYVNMSFDEPLVLPVQDNHLIQASILNWINDSKYNKFMHDEGYRLGYKQFKMYTFSRLQGAFEFNKADKTITYYNNCRLVISSADDSFITYILNTLSKEETIRLGDNNVYVDGIRCFSRKLKGTAYVYSLSPVVVYKTIDRHTKYYTPQEPEFKELIERNIMNKYQAFTGKDASGLDFDAEPIEPNRFKKNIAVYKGIGIEGWSGKFKIQGSPELLNLAYNSGLGTKSSQGFGCIEMYKEQKGA